MWRKLQLFDKIWFLFCKINDNEVQCILYDFKDSWYEYENWETVLKRFKQLNKRIQYDELMVRKILQQAEADKVICEERGLEKILKLTHYIHSCPFNIQWNLRKQSVEEFKKTIVLPIFETVYNMSQQIAELKENLVKKDIEILQYKREGAALQRTTVATQPFNFVKFEEKYVDPTATKGLQQIAECIYYNTHSNENKCDRSNTPKKKVAATQNYQINQTASNTEHAVNEHTIGRQTKLPNRKRKALEIRQRHLEMKLNTRNQKMAYESSQGLSQEATSSKSVEDNVNSNYLPSELQNISKKMHGETCKLIAVKTKRTDVETEAQAEGKNSLQILSSESDSQFEAPVNIQKTRAHSTKTLKRETITYRRYSPRLKVNTMLSDEQIAALKSSEPVRAQDHTEEHKIDVHVVETSPKPTKNQLTEIASPLSTAIELLNDEHTDINAALIAIQAALKDLDDKRLKDLKSNS